MGDKGRVYWLTGLSGAGKSTIGRALHERVKSERSDVVFLDGDELREVFGNDLGYDVDSRKRSAMRNARLCKLLSDQGLAVVCCTISMWDEIWEWNRANIPNYIEVYIKAPLHVLKERDYKGVYSRPENVWGVDINLREPPDPAIALDNDGTRSPDELADLIYNTTAKGE